MTRMALFTVVLITAMIAAVYGQEPVYFADPNLKAAVEKKLRTRDPNATEMLALTSFSLRPPRNAVNNLAGIEYAANIAVLLVGRPKTILWPSSNYIFDLSPLSMLTNLTKLSLVNSHIADISALSKLTNLTKLRLTANNITHISALSGLTSLKELYLEYNQIDDISVLAGFTKLEHLYLSGNQISDISALAGMTNLRSLWLDNNQISDISALSASMENLRHLNLRNNRISDISVLTQLADLRDVELEGNPLNEQAHRIYIPGIPALTPPKGYRHPDLTPPLLPTAIVRADNDYAFEEPYQDRGSELVKLPEPVWEKICDVTLKGFNSMYYEALTKYSDLFGPVFRIQVSDSDHLHLYVYIIKGTGTYSDIICLFLHDCRTDKVTPEPLRFSARNMRMAEPPYIDFVDLNLDGNAEVVFQRGEYFGTDTGKALYHYFNIGHDLSLNEIFLLKTRRRYLTGNKGWCRLDRWIQISKPNQIIVRTLLSEGTFGKDGLDVGYAVFESSNASSPFGVKETFPYIAEYAHALTWRGAEE